MTKKVLIITYYWPPAGGSAVYRWLKFTKYLREFGWEPVIYTAENGEYAEIDNSNQKDIPNDITILKQPIWEPYMFYKKFIGQKKTEKVNVGFLTERKKPKFAEKVAVWIRGNFFIPDARKFWIKPSANYLIDYLKQNPVDAVISSGPPHSMHLIALQLKKKLNIPWIADFRDPWTNIDYYPELLLTPMADRKHHRLEKKVVTTANCVVTVGSKMTEEFAAIGAKHVETITNGFDTSDYDNTPVELDKDFTIAHFGTINKARNPVVLWNALSQMLKEHSDLEKHLKLKFIGRIDASVIASLQETGLIKFLDKTEFIPHNEVVTKERQSQLLLLLINNTPNAEGILTGKFFEYLAAKRPIIAIGPTKGDVANILHESNAGEIAGFNDVQSLVEILTRYFNQFKAGTLNVNTENINAYSRYELTRKLTGILNDITQK
jgi:glycosyltransferase involved in cell wall biosynthesis